MESRIISNIKLSTIDNIVRFSNKLDYLDSLVKKLFHYFKSNPIYLSGLIRSINYYKLDYSIFISENIFNSSPAVQKECIRYFSERKDMNYHKEIFSLIENHNPDIRIAVIDYLEKTAPGKYAHFMIERYDIEKDIKVRAAIIHYFHGLSPDRKIKQFFLTLKKSIIDEREWVSFVNVMCKRKEYHEIIRILDKLPVVVRIEFYKNLCSTSDYNLKTFLWKRFEIEQDIGKIALYSIVPIETDSQIDMLIRSVESLGKVYNRKIVGIISQRNDCEKVSEKIINYMIRIITSRVIRAIRRSENEDFLKTCIRFFRMCKNESEKNNMKILLDEIEIDIIDKQILNYLLDNPIGYLTEKISEIIEEASFCNDLHEEELDISLIPWIRFLMDKDSVDFSLLYCFSILIESIRDEVILYGAKKGSKLVASQIISYIKEKKIGLSDKAIRYGKQYIDNSLQRFLLYNFSTYDSSTKCEILDLFRDNISENIPLLRSAVSDESLDVRIKAIIMTKELKKEMREDFLAPLIYSKCPLTSLIAILQMPVLDNDRLKLAYKKMIASGTKKILAYIEEILNSRLKEDILLILVLSGISPGNIKIKQSFFEMVHKGEMIKRLILFLNGELLCSDIKTFEDALSVIMIHYCLSINDISTILDMMKENNFKTAVFSEFRELLEFSYIDIYKDILNHDLKEKYEIIYEGIKYNISIPDEIKKEINIFPENKNRIIFKIASACSNNGYYQETINYLKLLNEEENQSDKYNYLMGNSYLRLGHISMALPYLEKLKPEETLEYLYESACYFDEKREWRTALHFLRKIAEVDMNFKDVSQKIIDIEGRIKKLSSKDFPFDIDRFQDIEEIGSGGMGKVYKAFDIKRKKNVAIKVLSKEYADNMRIARRFIFRDGFVAQKLDHPAIIHIYDVNRESSPPYIVMEFLDGKTLKEHIPENGMIEKEAIRIFYSLLEAVSYAHSKKVIHRDLKPENIMIDYKGNVKLMDFGLAKKKDATTMTQVGETFGTLYYMSPEQLRGEETDERADIFSLGVILYQMLTGKLPFSGDNPETTMYKIFKEKPIAPSKINEKFKKWDNIILKALNKDAKNRFQKVDEFYNELKKVKIIPLTNNIID